MIFFALTKSNLTVLLRYEMHNLHLVMVVSGWWWGYCWSSRVVAMTVEVMAVVMKVW